MELQQDLLAEQNMTLNKAVTQAVARETAKRSQGIQQVVTGISTYEMGLNKVVVPPDCCARCGNKQHSDWMNDCPAKDFVCTCGIKGRWKENHQERRGRLQLALARTASA
jgi:hypothetical protein